MARLKWKEAEPGFGDIRRYIHTEYDPIDVDFSDLNPNWGSKTYYHSLGFTISEKMSPLDDYPWMLTFHGCHFKVNSIEEAKEIAEKIYECILKAYVSRYNEHI